MRGTLEFLEDMEKHFRDGDFREEWEQEIASKVGALRKDVDKMKGELKKSLEESLRDL